MFNIGISDTEGEVDFYVPSATGAASLVANEDEFHRRKCDKYGNYTGDMTIEIVKCKVRTLDTIVAENHINDIVFIKIDVEGNEMAVLKGAKKTIDANKPVIYCELLRKHAKRFGYHPNDVINYMSNLGYNCKTMRDGELVAFEEMDDNTEETNFFFIY